MTTFDLTAPPTSQWGVVEWAVPLGREAQIEATLTHESGITRVVRSFADGAKIRRLRFLAELVGRWEVRWSSDCAVFDGVRSHVVVTEAKPGDHGIVRTDGLHFAHADGTPFRPVGTTAYNTFHERGGIGGRTIEEIAKVGFNKLRFLVLPQHGAYCERTPERMPFEQDDRGAWDYTRPDPSYFAVLDRAVQSLAAARIQADLILFHPYDRGAWKFDQMTLKDALTYVEYVVARYAAYPNVWWSLANEYDAMSRSEEDWCHLVEVVSQQDPYRHLLSIHNWLRLFDHGMPEITHASIQNGAAAAAFGRATIYRDAIGKPIVLDEIKYEGDLPQRWGALSGEELVRRFWIATLSGCYASHGESFVTESGSLAVVEGGPLRGDSPSRLGFLRRLLDEVPAPGLEPIDPHEDPENTAGVPGEFYLRYFGADSPAEWSFRLPQGDLDRVLEVGMSFSVDLIDTWNMTIQPLPDRYVLDRVEAYQAFASSMDPIRIAAPWQLLRIRRCDPLASTPPLTPHES